MRMIKKKFLDMWSHGRKQIYINSFLMSTRVVTVRKFSLRLIEIKFKQQQNTT